MKGIPILFIAEWSKESSSRLLHLYPSSLPFDLNLISLKIFLTFNGLYYSRDEKEIQGTFFTIAINNIGRIARIFLDKINDDNMFNEDKSKLFIVVLLVPDYFSEDKVSVESAKKILKIIYIRFWKEFHDLIINFQGNVTPFYRFINIIESLDLTLIKT